MTITGTSTIQTRSRANFFRGNGDIISHRDNDQTKVKSEKKLIRYPKNDNLLEDLLKMKFAEPEHIVLPERSSPAEFFNKTSELVTPNGKKINKEMALQKSNIFKNDAETSINERKARSQKSKNNNSHLNLLYFDPTNTAKISEAYKFKTPLIPSSVDEGNSTMKKKKDVRGCTSKFRFDWGYLLE